MEFNITGIPRILTSCLKHQSELPVEAQTDASRKHAKLRLMLKAGCQTDQSEPRDIPVEAQT